MSFIYSMTDTWNAIGTTFNGIFMNISDGAGGAPVGAAASRAFKLQANGTTIIDVDISGNVYMKGTTLGINTASPVAAGLCLVGNAYFGNVDLGGVYNFRTALSINSPFAFSAAGTTDGGVVLFVNAGTTVGTVAGIQVNGSASASLSFGVRQTHATGDSTFAIGGSGTGDYYLHLAPDVATAWGVGSHITSAGIRAFQVWRDAVGPTAPDFKINDSGNTIIAGTITLKGGATLLGTTAALTDGAAAQAGTLLNSPAAGNPTKWAAVNDAGTTRYLPLW